MQANLSIPYPDCVSDAVKQRARRTEDALALRDGVEVCLFVYLV
jgi:hypothetical protein